MILKKFSMTDNLPYLSISIVISFLITLSLILINKKLGNKFIDNFDGVQKFHSSPTPRIGGISIFISFLISIYLIGNDYKTFQFLIFISVLPAFLIGVIEDIKRNINPNYRLLATFLSGFLFIMLTGYHIKELDIFLIDNILSIYVFSLILTCFAISGVVNAINIIDGFHGLASGSLIIMFASFAMIGWYTEDYLISNLAIISILIYAGFFILNFPFGFIFLGDSGAYFGGFLLSILAIMLPYRNPEISSWVSFLICLYPITETLFSIYRKTKEKDIIQQTRWTSPSYVSL